VPRHAVKGHDHASCTAVFLDRIQSIARFSAFHFYQQQPPTLPWMVSMHGMALLNQSPFFFPATQHHYPRPLFGSSLLDRRHYTLTSVLRQSHPTLLVYSDDTFGAVHSYTICECYLHFHQTYIGIFICYALPELQDHISSTILSTFILTTFPITS
jgi:hypothetical protein